MSLKEKMLAVLVIATVCMFVLNSCTCSDVQAQECYPPDTTGVESDVFVWDDVIDAKDLGLTGDITLEWVYSPYSDTIHEFLELYKGYETQCYNDSTLGWLSDDSGWAYEHGWIHEDPTFTGFIEYLRKPEKAE